MPATGDLNLNLLRHLDALLQMRTVAGAARRLGLSQPTMSVALSQLRAHFGDPLLTRQHNVPGLTPLGEELRPAVAAALQLAQNVFDLASVFDPATSTRVFSFLCSDYWAATLGSRLVQPLRDAGWSGEARFSRPDTRFLSYPDARLASVDGALLPHGIVHGYPHLDLLTDEWVLLMDRDHELARAKAVRLDDLERFPWVLVRSGVASGAPEVDVLGVQDIQQHGVTVRAEVVTDSQLAAPALLPGTSRLMLAQRSGLSRLGPQVVARPLPLALHPLTLALWWHPLHQDDAGHRWFRSVVGGI